MASRSRHRFTRFCFEGLFFDFGLCFWRFCLFNVGVFVRCLVYKGWSREVALWFFIHRLRNKKELFKCCFRQFTRGTFFKKVSNTCFCNQIDSNRSNIDVLDATLAEISQGSRIPHADPPKPQNLVKYLFFVFVEGNQANPVSVVVVARRGVGVSNAFYSHCGPQLSKK